jgi:hypothetical protein
MQYIYNKITGNPTASLVIGAAVLLGLIYLFQERCIEEKIRDRFRAYKMMPEGDFRTAIQQRADDQGISYERMAFLSAIYDLKRQGSIPTDREYNYEDYKDA